MQDRERSGWVSAVFVLVLAVAWLLPANMSRSRVNFTGEPSRGAFVAGSKFPIAAVSHCLVYVTGDEPSEWRYEVWREDNPSRRLKGTAAVVPVVPQ